VNDTDIVPPLKLGELPWRKSLRSIGNGECVETAPLSGNVAVRDSQNVGGAVLLYSAEAWRSFLHGAKNGDFDQLG
jgi:Domain of unknown function (DUF397)